MSDAVGRVALLVLCVLFLPPSLESEVIEMGTRRVPRFGRLRLGGTEIFQGGDSTRDIRLRSRSHTASPDNLLHLDFDARLPALLRDAAGNFSIRQSSYIFTSDARAGRGAALFNRLENRIVINSPEELWPGTGAMADFSIEMWLKPAHFGRQNMIFRKSGLETSFTDGIPRGIEIFTRHQRIIFFCRNLFRDSRGRLRTVRLNSRTGLVTGRWVHFLVSFRASSGKLVMYLNGREERVRFARDRSGVWPAGFGRLDRSPMVIGESYVGIIDEFRIAGTAHDFPGKTAHTAYRPLRYDAMHLIGEQKTGFAVSEVIALPRSHISRRARLRYRSLEPGGSALNFWIRTSLRPFRADASPRRLPWRRLHNGADKLAAFSHFQWKAELRPDPDGKFTPVLKEIRLAYVPHQRPVTPRNLHVVTEGPRNGRDLFPSRQACLEWSRNPEPRVHSERGGYFVYYGVRPGEYLGRLVYRENARGQLVPINTPAAENMPITESERKLRRFRPRAFRRTLGGRMRLLITNDLIERNIIRLRREGADARMPLLRNNRTYYFAVSAYFRTIDDILLESRLSREAMAVLRDRPDL